MMLSISAARMGSVLTMLKHNIGKCRWGFSAARMGCCKVVFCSGAKKNKPLYALTVLAPDVCRWKSMMAANSDLEDNKEVFDRSHGYKEAAKARSAFSHKEGWMVNLGHNDSNEWLLGDRNLNEWYTGLKPTLCPGTDTKGFIRSLPLPMLDAVTQEVAKDYFDNSWTLYETLFAGLNSKESFYRPPVQHRLHHPPQIFYYGHMA